MLTLTARTEQLRMKYLGFKKFKPNLKERTLEGEIIPGASVLIRTNDNRHLNGDGILKEHGVVQYEIVQGEVDTHKLSPAACLVEGKAVKVAYPVSYEYVGGGFKRIYGSPIFKNESQ